MVCNGVIDTETVCVFETLALLLSVCLPDGDFVGTDDLEGETEPEVVFDKVGVRVSVLLEVCDTDTVLVVEEEELVDGVCVSVVIGELVADTSALGVADGWGDSEYDGDADTDLEGRELSVILELVVSV